MIALVPISSPAPLALVTAAEMKQLVAQGYGRIADRYLERYGTSAVRLVRARSLLASSKHAREKGNLIKLVMYLTDRLSQRGSNRGIVWVWVRRGWASRGIFASLMTMAMFTIVIPVPEIIASVAHRFLKPAIRSIGAILDDRASPSFITGPTTRCSTR